MKKAFGLWQAIMIILIISGLMIVVLKYSRIAAEHTGDTYVRQQLELYLNSAVEQTLLAISLSQVADCNNGYIVPQGGSRSVTYNGTVHIKKIYLVENAETPTLPANCNITTIGTEESHGMMLLAVEVTATSNGQVVSRILRRTLQRP